MAEEMHSCRRLVSTPEDSMLRREEKEEASPVLHASADDFLFPASSSLADSVDFELAIECLDAVTVTGFGKKSKTN